MTNDWDPLIWVIRTGLFIRKWGIQEALHRPKVLPSQARLLKDGSREWITNIREVDSGIFSRAYPPIRRNTIKLNHLRQQPDT